MQSVKCVLFDLDGTLVDTAPDLLASLNAVLTRVGGGVYGIAVDQGRPDQGARRKSRDIVNEFRRAVGAVKGDGGACSGGSASRPPR